MNWEYVGAMLLVVAAILVVSGIFSDSRNTTGFVPLEEKEILDGAPPSANLLNEMSEFRLQYGIPLGVFDALPPAPYDFNEMVTRMQKDRFRNFRFYSEAYYLQPEFYPSFPEHALPYWKTPNPDYYGAMGYGFYPRSQQVRMGAGEERMVRFFVHAGFGVRSWQGMHIQEQENDTPVEIEIVNPEFVLGPNFPKFSLQWARAADVRVRVPAGTAVGVYRIQFSLAPPSAANSAAWDEQYSPYFDAASADAGIVHIVEVVVE